MATEKYMSPKEFLDKGYVQEANRIFFHPLGIQLEVHTDENGKEEIKVLDKSIISEGIYMSQAVISSEKVKELARYFYYEINKRMELRINILGFGIQPVQIDTSSKKNKL